MERSALFIMHGERNGVGDMPIVYERRVDTALRHRWASV
jgi:hypothetical protein